MVRAGEDPHYIFRRMLVFAGEDVGLADPRAVGIVESAAAAFDRVGLPEGRFHLSQAALYLATAPKSNSTLGFFEALGTVEEESAFEVPNHLRDGNRDKEGFGHGEGYLYPHAFRDHWVAQQYLPSGLQGKVFYNPSTQGYEGSIREAVVRRRDAQVAAVIEDAVPEILTSSPKDGKREAWVRRSVSGTSTVLSVIRDTLYEYAQPPRHATILVAGDAGGLLMKEAVRRCPEGGIWVTTHDDTQYTTLAAMVQDLPEEESPIIMTPADSDALAIETQVEYIIGRNTLTRVGNRDSATKKLCTALAQGGTVVLCEVLPYKGQRLSAYISDSDLDAATAEDLTSAETVIYRSSENDLVNWTEEDLARWISQSGISVESMSLETFDEQRMVRQEDLENWFTSSSPGSYGAVLRERLDSKQIEEVKRLLVAAMTNRMVPWHSTYAFIKARKSGE
jgi:putative ATPase